MTRLTSDALSRLQRRVLNEIPDRFRFARILAVLALNEEAGELLAEFSRIEPDGVVSKEFASELGDVVLSAIEIANAYGLELQHDAEFSANGDRRGQLFSLCETVFQINRDVLELEGFDCDERAALHERLNRLVRIAELLASAFHADILNIFEEKFARIVGLVEDGSWERRYGDLLLAKRKKFD